MEFSSWKWPAILFIFSLQNRFILNYNFFFTNVIWEDRIISIRYQLLDIIDWFSDRSFVVLMYSNLKKSLKSVVREIVVTIKQLYLKKSFKEDERTISLFLWSDSAVLNIKRLSHHGEPGRGESISYTTILFFFLSYLYPWS